MVVCFFVCFHSNFFDNLLILNPFLILCLELLFWKCITYVLDCLVNWFNWLDGSIIKYLTVCLIIVMRNGRIVCKVVWIEYYLRLNLTYSASDNVTPPISRVLIGRHLIFGSLKSPTCCNLTPKCTPVKYKKRQKPGFPSFRRN